jgi:predicted RNA binding protein YcfA (HicA-like mRNA interferase family)
MHPELANITSDDVIRILVRAGFIFKKQKGSHRQYTAVIEGRKRKVTVKIKQKRFKPKTLNSMISQSGLSEEEWLALN